MEVSNFRSIVHLKVELGRVNVVIGANGSGKSNLLEAIAVAGAAAALRGDNEFLASRGVRPMAVRLVMPRFPASDLRASPSVVIDGKQYRGSHGSNGGDYLEFEPAVPFDAPLATLRIEEHLLEIEVDLARIIRAFLLPSERPIRSFLIFSPDYHALRTFSDEGQILPLGVRGEGLFKHLIDLTKRHPDVVARISEHLRVLDWFDGFVIPNDLGPGEKRLAIRDRYLDAEVSLDQRSANEGFLFLLFVYTALLSPETPRFFAIDNADTSLNPRVCARMMSDIVSLAKEVDKQVIVTTHNPALLDGLDLTDDAQRLFVCERDLDGYTALRRVPAPKGATRLSEAFLRGYLGGLPRSF